MNRREFLMSSGGVGIGGAAAQNSAILVPLTAPTIRSTGPDKDNAIGYLVKKSSSEIDDSPWGMDFITIGDDISIAVLLKRIGESGVKWARVRAGWSSVEGTTKGAHDWRQLDEIVDGMTIIAILHATRLRGL